MNSLKLTSSYLKFRKLNTLLIIIVLALGYSTVSLILNFSKSFEEKLENDARTVDLVVGAKGSPLQLILSSIYHVDIPNGNISHEDAEKIAHMPEVKAALFIGLGDNHKNYRIVGTEAKYLDFYKAKIAEGVNFQKPFETVIGSEVAKNGKLKIGDTFVGAHGLTGSDDLHTEFPYKVVGILEQSGNITDKLIFTPIESVWAVHAKPDPDEPNEESMHNDITAVLLQLKSPMSGFSLPRIINRTTGMLAANPAFESARLLELVSFGTKFLQAFAYIMISTSMLMIFITLYTSLKERIFDYAVIRAIGGSKAFIAFNVIQESLIVTLAGLVLGFFITLAVINIVPSVMPELSGLRLTDNIFSDDQLILIAALIASAIIASLIPAITAYRVNIAKNLQK